MATKGGRPLRVVLVLLLSLYASAAVRSQEAQYWKWDNGIGHSNWDLGMEKEDAEKLRRLWDAIGEDLKTEREGLAGTYLKGGYNAGYFFRWSVGKGYILIPYFDQSLITDFSYGAVKVVNASEVSFTPERDLRKGGRGIGGMPRRWAAVGKYFVPVEMLGEFGEYMAGLGRYNEFNGRCCEFAPEFLAARIDGPGEQVEHPVPPKYARFIKRPVEAEVTFVGKKKVVKDWGYEGKLYSEALGPVALIPVRINAGSGRGLKRNMLLRLVGQPDFYQYLQVMRVARRTASGYVVRDISSGGKETYKDLETGEEKPLGPVEVGMRVTTSLARD
jgi:hypothetical protein